MDLPSGESEPHALWSAVIVGIVVLIPGLIGLATGQLLLFPNLGPTAVMQAHNPRHRSSRLYNVLTAHLIGITVGYAAVALCGLTHSPSVFAAHALTLARVAAAGLALLVGTAGEVLLDAAHPPAAATTLLIALGSFRPVWADVTRLVAGVLIVGIAGEIGRRVQVRYR